MILKKIIQILKATIFLIVAFCYAQPSIITQLENNINQNNINNAYLLINGYNDKNLTLKDKAKWYYLKAHLFQLDNKDNQAYNAYIIAKENYKSLNQEAQVAKINIETVSLLLAMNKSYVDYKYYLDDYINYAKKSNNPNDLSKSYMEIGKSFYDYNPKIAIAYFKKAMTENIKTSDDIYKARILQNLGATYASDAIMQLDSALIVYEKALKIYKKHQLTDKIFYIYVNKGVALTKKRDYKNAIYYLLKADSLPIKEFKNKSKEALYGFLSNAYKEKGDYKKAIEYIEKQKVYQEILDENEQIKAIKDIDTKYKTKQKEKENLSLKQKLAKNKQMIYLIIIVLIIVIIMSILSYKNINKKKKIAEQQEYIAKQELEKKLKQQEINEIDLMLESQEKERQRIANELHDSIGSMLATLKLNFEHLKRKDTTAQNDLYEKTDSLINDAYQEVRNISHLKNLGVKGNEGLLISVKKMAEKMSILQKLQVNVIPFGLYDRLENTTEVTLFRIIQELCTNCIKHANASEINIYLTQHHTADINIIIEDNGTGFDIKNIKQSDGIGLKNIEKKIEQLGGTFTIDSIISRGTTIIIDLPL